MSSIEELTSAADRARAEWLEDVLAGLVMAGVSKNDIEVQEHPGGVTRVAVRGLVKYQFEHLIRTTP